MSHTNSTTNYALPQFITTDKPFWLTDINQAFSDIDAGIKAAKDAGDNAQNDATQALSDASAASSAASAADGKGAGAVASIADTFDATSTYVVGDHVMYNSLLYRCTVAITTPGPWSGSANWTRDTLENMNLNKANLPQLITATVNSTLFEDSHFHIREFGGIVFIDGIVKVKADIHDGDIILSGLPARLGYRDDNVMPVHIGNHYFNGPCDTLGAFIDGSGNLCIATGTAITDNTRYLMINGCYMTA